MSIESSMKSSRAAASRLVNERVGPNTSAQRVLTELHAAASPERAALMQRYFKTAEGQYGYGDIFLGLSVPQTRKIAANSLQIAPAELDELAQSKEHEARLCALVILTTQFKRAKRQPALRESLLATYDCWLRAGYVNNWDLVDVSAPTLGQQLFTPERGSESTDTYLAELAAADSLWMRRASVLYTFAALSIGQIQPTLTSCERLVYDSEDLINKAVGWALREVGKRDIEALKDFLRAHISAIPRVTLRYAIEKMPEAERQKWLRYN